MFVVFGLASNATRVRAFRGVWCVEVPFEACAPYATHTTRRAFRDTPVNGELPLFGLCFRGVLTWLSFTVFAQVRVFPWLTAGQRS